MVEAVAQSPFLHADETGWREGALPLWFWVFRAADVVIYWIGSRAKEMFVNALPEGLSGWLMSDGYSVYRHYENRLRCWAHLLRKARGLAEATCRRTREVGQALLALMARLMENVHLARGSGVAGLAERQQPDVDRLKTLCESHRDSASDKLGAFCRELLKDWMAIIRPLFDPGLPLTNNAAERQLRHWVIARKISFGTRSEQGSRTVALLASIIDTCCSVPLCLREFDASYSRVKNGGVSRAAVGVARSDHSTGHSGQSGTLCRQGSSASNRSRCCLA